MQEALNGEFETERAETPIRNPGTPAQSARGDAAELIAHQL